MRAKHGGSVPHFYDGLWYDPRRCANRQPTEWEVDMLTTIIKANPMRWNSYCVFICFRYTPVEALQNPLAVEVQYQSVPFPSPNSSGPILHTDETIKSQLAASSVWCVAGIHQIQSSLNYLHPYILPPSINHHGLSFTKIQLSLYFV